MVYLAKELKYVTDEQYVKVYNLSIETSRLISGFIKKLT